MSGAPRYAVILDPQCRGVEGSRRSFFSRCSIKAFSREHPFAFVVVRVFSGSFDSPSCCFAALGLAQDDIMRCLLTLRQPSTYCEYLEVKTFNA